MRIFHCIALHCPVLHCIALYCIVLHCIASHCIVFYYIILHCIVSHCIALHCIALRCTVLYCITLRCITLYCIVLYSKGIASYCILYCIVKVLHCITRNWLQARLSVYPPQNYLKLANNFLLSQTCRKFVKDIFSALQSFMYIPSMPVTSIRY